MLLVLAVSSAQAAVTQTSGAGTSVTSADRAATFDALNANGIDLSAYTEDQIDVWVNDTTFVGFDAFAGGAQTMFHYGTGGNNSYVTIKASDGLLITGLEFLAGSGFFSIIDGGPGYYIWEAYKDGNLVGSGTSASDLMGTVIGWNDPEGFHELHVGNYVSNTDLLGVSENAIALDDLSLQFSPVTPATPVPTLAPISLLLMIILMALVPLAFRSIRPD